MKSLDRSSDVHIASTDVWDTKALNLKGPDQTLDTNDQRAQKPAPRTLLEKVILNPSPLTATQHCQLGGTRHTTKRKADAHQF
eukprot:4914225-Amphidinium_carterae.1